MIDGKKMELKGDESFVYWTPAPPKWEVAPSHVKEQLFPSYHGAAMMLDAEASQMGLEEVEEEEEEEEVEEDEEEAEELRALER